MSSTVVIPARFNGPPASANGGYACGVVGTLIGDAAEVTLRLPPPLDSDLSIHTDVSSDGPRVRMMNGDALIASGRAAELDVTCPDPPTAAMARAAEASYASVHPFPSCFVCGPARAEGDGLRLFTGKVEGRPLVACGWTPGESVGAGDGTVERAVVWSALDCPSYFGGRLNDYGRLSLLGRMTAKLVSPVRVGAPHVVVGWPLGRDGRKWEGGSAVFTADGELCAYARGLWIEVKS